jgi:predicted GNAT family N-acyltransferase
MSLSSETIVQGGLNVPFTQFGQPSFAVEGPVEFNKSRTTPSESDRPNWNLLNPTPFSFYIPSPASKQEQKTFPLKNGSDLTQQKLSIRVLKTPEERLLIAHLRQYTDFESERDLDPGLEAIDNLKDSLGIVMAIYLNQRIITTIRFVPTGHGVTLTERLWQDAASEREIFGHNTWEIGRLIMAPEDRHPDLLPRCLALALSELVKLKNVTHLHATATVLLSRLYRRFGFRTEGVLRSKGGKQFTLIYGQVRDVAAALKVPFSHIPSCNTVFKSCTNSKQFIHSRKFGHRAGSTAQNQIRAD